MCGRWGLLCCRSSPYLDNNNNNKLEMKMSTITMQRSSFARSTSVRAPIGLKNVVVPRITKCNSWASDWNSGGKVFWGKLRGRHFPCADWQMLLPETELD